MGCLSTQSVKCSHKSSCFFPISHRNVSPEHFAISSSVKFSNPKFSTKLSFSLHYRPKLVAPKNSFWGKYILLAFIQYKSWISLSETTHDIFYITAYASFFESSFVCFRLMLRIGLTWLLLRITTFPSSSVILIIRMPIYVTCPVIPPTFI